MKTIPILVTLSLGLMILLCGCTQTPAGGGTVTPAVTTPASGIANPAAVYCSQQAGTKYEIRKDASGNEYGVCILPDGMECEEWAYYRRECPATTPAGIANPAATYCTQQTGTRYEIRTNSTDGSQYGVCILPDGTVCDEWAYFRHECPAPVTTPGAQLANPSATFCVEKNYSYQIVTNPDGSQSGNCVFPSGKACDGWAYFRGECNETTAK